MSNEAIKPKTMSMCATKDYMMGWNECLQAVQSTAHVEQGGAEHVLELAASTIELFDDKTMENDYMLDAGECAAIIRALKSYPITHPAPVAPVPSDFDKALSDFAANLAASQVPLGDDFSKVLHDNLWDMYVTDEPVAPVPEAQPVASIGDDAEFKRIGENLLHCISDGARARAYHDLVECANRFIDARTAAPAVADGPQECGNCFEGITYADFVCRSCNGTALAAPQPPAAVASCVKCDAAGACSLPGDVCRSPYCLDIAPEPAAVAPEPDDFERRHQVAVALGLAEEGVVGVSDGKRVGFAWSYLLMMIKSASDFCEEQATAPDAGVRDSALEEASSLCYKASNDYMTHEDLGNAIRALKSHSPAQHAALSNADRLDGAEINALKEAVEVLEIESCFATASQIRAIIARIRK